MWWEGCANLQDDATVDLSALNKTQVSVDRSFTSVGGGARWSDVYLKLDAMNLSVVGGRIFNVGVSGSTLGGQYPLCLSGIQNIDRFLGGHSFSAPRYGFVCDNVLKYEVPHSHHLYPLHQLTLPRSSSPQAPSSTPTALLALTLQSPQRRPQRLRHSHLLRSPYLPTKPPLGRFRCLPFQHQSHASASTSGLHCCFRYRGGSVCVD